MTELDLRETLERHVGAIDVPPAPLGPVVVKGRRRQRRRRAVIGTSVTAVLAVVAASGAALMLSNDEGRGADTSQYASLGALDFSHGARAYADPGSELHLAGRTFPAKDLDYLDTDAVATSYGMVFYDHGRPMLLGTDGEVQALVDGPLDNPDDFHPTAKVDSKHAWVAYATRRGITTTLTVHDLSTGRDVASTTIDCPGCTDLVIDAFDDGVVYVRIDHLVRAWRIDEDKWEDLADGGTRIADVRNGVVLYDGKAPADVGLTRVEAPIDATLTFDGKYILNWSSRLGSTDGSPDLVLDQGPTGDKGGLAFYAIDSDGSVLVARTDGKYPNFLVYDCDALSGACEELGPLKATGGDPQFIGQDM
jgi:hypothetical protein